MSNGIFLSIIIPTINRYGDLVNTINDLEKQSFQDFEVIIIDQTKNLKPPEFNNNKIRYYTQKELSASKARNIGIQKAKGEIILFIDDDVIIKNTQFLQSYVQYHLNDPHLAGVTGPILSKSNPELRYKKHWLSNNKNWGWLFFPPNYGNQLRINSAVSCNMSVRKEFALAIGGMDENYIKGAHREESDFNERLTKKYGPYLYSPECTLWHIGNPVGGIRTWKETGVKAQHHFDSSWYFLFKNINLNHYFPHLLSMVLFFVVFEKLMFKPKSLIIVTSRIIKGYFNAKQMIRKSPNYIIQNNIKA